MDPLRMALLAGALPGALALAGLLGATLMAPKGDDGRAPLWAARLVGALAAGLGVALSFILLQHFSKPGTLALWPVVAIDRVPTLTVVGVVAAVVVAVRPRSLVICAAAMAVAGAVFAWGIGAPIKREVAALAPLLAIAAGWGAVVGGLWHFVTFRNLADRGDAAPLVASGLVPLGAAPVFFFGGASALPQPAMSLATVAGVALVVILMFGARRAAPACAGIAPLLAAIMLLLSVAMVVGYRPSAAALAMLMGAPLGLVPARILSPRRGLVRWAVALAPVAAIVIGAGIVAWQMAPKDTGYGY